MYFRDVNSNINVLSRDFRPFTQFFAVHTCGRYQRQISQLAIARAGKSEFRRQTERSNDPPIQRSNDPKIRLDDDQDGLQFDAGRCRWAGGDRQFNIQIQRRSPP